MYLAIYYSTAASYNKYKLATNVIQAHDPFNMIVIDSADKVPGTSSEIKNTFTFADLDQIPANRAFIAVSDVEKHYFDEAVTYLKANRITIVEALYNMSMIIVEIPRGSYASFEAKIIASTISIDYIEQDQVVKVDLNYAIPYTSHWHLNNIQAQCAWDAMSSFGTSNAEEPYCGEAPYTIDEGSNCCTKPEVALLDQGVQRSHPDLHGMLSGCAWDEETGRFEEDYNWNVLFNNDIIDPVHPSENHGTAMAGVIAANNLNNNYGLSAAQNYVRVQVLKVLYIPISPGPAPTYSSYTAYVQAINRAVQNPRCAAINMSFGGSAANQSFQNAITYARTQGRAGKGIPVFASAGNGPCNGGCPAVVNQIKYPANYPYANAIGASGLENTKMTWSDFGTKLFIAAPGTAILTTDRTGTVGYSTTSTSINVDVNNTNLAVFTNFGGTSAACGIISSVAACMVAVNPNITADQIESILAETAAETGGYVYDPVTGKSPELGHGVVRMCDAITAVVDALAEPTVPVLTLNITTASITTTTCGTATVAFTLSAEDDFWNGATQFVYSVLASTYPNLSTSDQSNAIPMNLGDVLPLSESGTYSIAFTVPNNSSLPAITDYLLLAINLLDANGQIVASVSSNTSVNDGLIVEDSIPMTITNGCPTQGVDLSVQVLSYSMVTNNQGQTNRTFRIKYTNTGTVAITSFNRSYGWVGGTYVTNTQTYPGTTSSNTPLLPGQSRTVNISFTGSNTPPQYPATYYHQINTVNGSADANNGNNYSIIVVTQ
jgi:hypothetical protein